MPVINNYQGSIEDGDVKKVTFEERPVFETSPDGRVTTVTGHAWYAKVTIEVGKDMVDAEVVLDGAEISAAFVASGIRDKLKAALRQKLGVS